MQLVADDLDVRALGLEHRHGGGADGLPERIVLVDQVDLLDVRLALHVVGEGLHLDVGVGVPAEVGEGAFVVGEHRIDRGIVEIDHFLAGVAVVVLGDPIGQCGGNGGAVALGDDAGAGVDRLLHLHEAFLRVGLVVEGQDLELLARRAALGVKLVRQELEGLEAHLADRGAGTRERIDVGDLDRVLGEGLAAGQGQCRNTRSSEHAGFHEASYRFPLLRLRAGWRAQMSGSCKYVLRQAKALLQASSAQFLTLNGQLVAESVGKLTAAHPAAAATGGVIRDD